MFREALFCYSNVNWYCHHEKQYGDFSKNYISKGKTPLIQKDTCTPKFIAALFTLAETWKQPSVHEQMNKDVAYVHNGIKRMKNENLLSAAALMLLEGIMLTERQILYLTTYMCNLKNK